VIPRILDRYLLKEWIKTFTLAALGLPLFVIIIELAEKLDEYLVKDLTGTAIALGYFFSLPDRIFLILPAAVLFATVFSVGNMSRHSELTAAKASGRGMHRVVLPVLLAATAAAGLGLVIGELTPPATRRQIELLEEGPRRARTSRYNFVYRAEEGWVYQIRQLNATRYNLRDLVLEREGTGPEYPTLAVQARRAQWDTTEARWTLANGRLRVISGAPTETAFAFDSAHVRSMVERPADLLVEPKKPQEMRYAELGRYVDALERSGGDGRLLRVEQALKIAVPITCIIIAFFSIPFVASGPRVGGAWGVAVALGTAIVFLVLVQLSRTIGSGGLLPPTLAAWVPNILFGVSGLWMFRRAPT
jgi:lipopolysaccharide export system permease protein